MTGSLVVMLIWLGPHYGGATIPGFQTIDACERSIPTVQKQFGSWGATYKCVVLPPAIEGTPR